MSPSFITSSEGAVSLIMYSLLPWSITFVAIDLLFKQQQQTFMTAENTAHLNLSCVFCSLM